MKYLFINSVAGFGSTGAIAARQCRQLIRQGHTCVLAYGRKKANCDDIPTLPIGTELDFRLHALRNRILDDHGAGSWTATRKLVAWIRGYDPDVIWLHNLHGYYLNLDVLFSYLRTCGKEIRWTLHDCWSFTGHCAYFDYAGCDRWKTGCHHCPEKKRYPQSWLLDNSRRNYEKKKKLFTGIPNLTLIVPSHWLKSRVQASFLREYPVQVVYNTINREIFRPTPSNFRREQGLEGKKIILGVASVWDARKGLADFAALSRHLTSEEKIVLVGLTQEQIRSLPEGILGLPRTDSPQTLAGIYTAADVYVSPSKEETFGMTVLEAQACGTPAVVYQGTACQEVAEQFGGIAVPQGPEHLLAAIRQLTKEAHL